MASNVVTFPNILTFLRMALIPAFASLLFYGYSGWALAAFLVAGISDGIDGFVARRFDQQTELGTILDPIADKLLMTTSFIVLSMKSLPDSGGPLVPFWVTSAVIGRDVLIVSVAIAINIMTGFKGFRPSWLGKLSTLVQVASVCLILVAAIRGTGEYLAIVHFSVVSLAVASGFHYMFHVGKLMREAEQGGPKP